MYRNVEEQNYVEAILQLVNFEDNEAYVIACQKQARKDVYRKWFLSGHLAKDNPKYADENGQIAKATREAFIGPVAPITVDPKSIRYSHTGGPGSGYRDERMYTGDWESVTTRAERERLEAAVEATQQAYDATPEGHAERQRLQTECRQAQEAQREKQQANAILYTQCLRRAPHRLYLSEEQAALLLGKGKQRAANHKKNPMIYRAGYDNDGFPARTSTSVIHSEVEGQYWKATNNIADYTYLQFIELAQATADERAATYARDKAKEDADLEKYGEAEKAYEPEETLAGITLPEFRRRQRQAAKQAGKAKKPMKVLKRKKPASLLGKTRV